MLMVQATVFLFLAHWEGQATKNGFTKDEEIIQCVNESSQQEHVFFWR